MITTVKGRFTDVEGTVVLDEATPPRPRPRSPSRWPASTRGSRSATRTSIRRLLRRRDVPDPHLPQHGRARRRRRRLHADRRPDDPRRHPRSGARRQVHEGRAKDPWGGERAGFTATTQIKRSEFGLTWNQLLETGGLAVSDDVKISLDVQLVKGKD